MKIAIYARVSTSEQDVNNQLRALRNYARALEGEIVEEYVDKASGKSSNRPEFRRLLKNAEQHKFDLVLVWALDRFSREGILNTLSYLRRLKENGVYIKSLQEPWLDTRDEGMGNLLIAIFSWVAEQERKRISERTKEGLKKAKNVGKRGKDKKPRRKSGYYLRWARVKSNKKTGVENL